MSQSDCQICQVQKRCNFRLPQQGSSSSEGNARCLWENNFRHNQLPWLSRSFIHTLFSSSRWSKWLSLDQQHSVNSFFQLEHSLDTFQEQKIEAQKFKNGVMKIFTQTECDISSETEFSTNHTSLAFDVYFSNPEDFVYKSATHCSSLNLLDDDAFPAKNERLQVNYASSEYLSSYSATVPRKDSSAMIPKIIHDLGWTYSTPQNGWHSPQKNLRKSHLAKTSNFSLGKMKLFQE